jgi:uncharacterized protein YkwD
MSDYTIYLMNKQPSVVVESSSGTTPSPSSGSPNTVIYLTNSPPVDKAFDINLLNLTSEYVKAVWGSNGVSISWRRKVETFGTSKRFYNSIIIEYSHPQQKWTPNPYWLETVLESISPMSPVPHVPPIAIHMYPPGIFQNAIPQTGQASDYWNKSVYDGQVEFEENQPIPRPGEAIQVRWSLNVDGSVKAGVVASVPYETPLFTGGEVVAAYDLGDITVRYDVKIHGQVVKGIPPTDFFEFPVGKWVYLWKGGWLKDEKQAFGLSSSSSSTASTASDILSLINSERASLGISSLSTDSNLEAAARWMSNDMKDNGVGVPHIGSDGSTAFERIDRNGFFANLDPSVRTGTCENIYVGNSKTTPQDIFNGWKSSTGHYANMVNVDMEHIGISQVGPDKNGNIYWTTDFAFREDYTSTTNYRVVPFNFGGPLHPQDMGIDYLTNDLFIDSATDFEEVFDMVFFEGTIQSVDVNNDTCEVMIATTKYTLPIYYHCTDDQSIDGGSSAFGVGDEVIVERPGNDPNFSDAMVIGFKDGVKTCTKDYIIYSVPGQILVWDPVFDQLAVIQDDSGAYVSGPVPYNSISVFLSKCFELRSSTVFSMDAATSLYDTPGRKYFPSTVWHLASAPSANGTPEIISGNWSNSGTVCGHSISISQTYYSMSVYLPEPGWDYWCGQGETSLDEVSNLGFCRFFVENPSVKIWNPTVVNKTQYSIGYPCGEGIYGEWGESSDSTYTNGWTGTTLAGSYSKEAKTVYDKSSDTSTAAYEETNTYNGYTLDGRYTDKYITVLNLDYSGTYSKIGSAPAAGDFWHPPQITNYNETSTTTFDDIKGWVGKLPEDKSGYDITTELPLSSILTSNLKTMMSQGNFVYPPSVQFVQYTNN